MAGDRQGCSVSSCFFCAMNESNRSLRRVKLLQCLKEMPLRDDQGQHVLALTGLWNIAMAEPNDPEFPSLGVFDCMAKLIQRAVNDKKWLVNGQNIYIPYYAAHIIGSYTMNRAQFAEKAVKSGVVLPLIEILRGKITWVEKRVAVRALGHIASHNRTFEAIVKRHEAAVVELAMEIALTCLNEVYDKFVGLNDTKRLKYHSNLITRGLGGLEIENRKAEEWASQLQCWSLYLLNCFVRRERSLGLICRKEFLKELSGMWGGLANPGSPSGIGLIKTLCETKSGRQSIAELEQVIETLCNTSRSSDDWQIMAIDSLLLLLKDPETRYKVIEISALYLGDLVELGNYGGKPKVGERITQTLLQDYHKIKYGGLRLKSKKAEKALEEIWDLKVDRRKREKLMSEEVVSERKSLVGQLKKQGNLHFWSGDIEKAVKKYTESLYLCPLKRRKERIVLHSNRAQCYLLLKDPDSAISDATRALCLSSEVSPHGKSLWRRSQAYDMKGLARESLMDCLVFVRGRIKSEKTSKRGCRIPYYAARMINKQMSATWIFAQAKLRSSHGDGDKLEEIKGHDEIDDQNIITPRCKSAIEEPLVEKRWRRRKLHMAGRSKISIVSLPDWQFSTREKKSRKDKNLESSLNAVNHKIGGRLED
ncbi:Clathrin, heavy chain [Parasponia andersonii]|uniref:Clathrin, heavy chain n=1 Tax=Parasponia andersonii TaxID=3476 RepID=A0A2P5D091_PARAD|nr:Clathrin, heavy chain [Parasponia andersonii]